MYLIDTEENRCKNSKSTGDKQLEVLTQLGKLNERAGAKLKAFAY